MSFTSILSLSSASQPPQRSTTWCRRWAWCWRRQSESLDGVSVSTSLAQSRLVSVSTSSKFPSLDESRSRHPANFQVSMSLGLDILEISQSRWVSVSTSKKLSSLYQVCFPDHQNPNWNGWDIECSFHKKNISFLCSQEVAQKFMVVG